MSFVIIYPFLAYALSLALVFPIAFATGDFYLCIFVELIVSYCFWFQYKKSRSNFGSFLNGILMGVLASMGIWVLEFIDLEESLKHSYLFVGSFFILFCLSSFITYLQNQKKAIRLPFFIFNLLALAGLILFLLFTNGARHKAGFVILFGGLIGLLMGYLLTLIFEHFFKVGLAVFGKIWHYIEVLLKPALIFFTGYLTIGALYAGVYHLIYRYSFDAFSFPSHQLAFLDFLLYAIDTMTTGGDSAVQANSLLAQFVNTLNVFTAIVWMTIILAATIGHSSERFKEVADRHKKMRTKTSKKKKALT